VLVPPLAPSEGVGPGGGALAGPADGVGDDDTDGAMLGDGEGDGDPDGATLGEADADGEAAGVGVAVVGGVGVGPVALGTVTVYRAVTRVAGKQPDRLQASPLTRWVPPPFGSGATPRLRTAVHSFGSMATREPIGASSQKNWASVTLQVGLPVQ
jgi:hypothetical protein